MGSQQTIQPTTGLITVPQNYPHIPTPGKLEILWDANNVSLYHRLSPYSDFNQSLINSPLGNTQPFYYIFADQNNKGFNALKKYESRVFPIGSAPIDVIRVSRFLGSGNGILFLGRQFLLQTSNAFDETRIYNPTSPVVAAGMGLALGTVRPMRSIDISGLGGIFRSLVGDSIPNAIFGEPKISAPEGTVAGALPDSTMSTGGKGLIRAGTANAAKAHLEKAWPQVGATGGLAQTFGSILKNVATSLFHNFIPQTQTGVVARSDEETYGLMIGGGNPRFSYIGGSGRGYDFGQLWVAGGRNIRKNGQYPARAYRVFVQYNNGVQNNSAIISNNGFTFSIPGIGSVGYIVQESGNVNKPGFRYGDSVGENISTQQGDEYTASDIMVQYKYYADPSQAFPTKNPDASKVKKINDTLKATLNDIKHASEGVYSVSILSDSTVLRSGQLTYDYNRLFQTNQRNMSPMNYPLGVLKDYRDVNVVDNTLTTNIAKSYKLPTAGKFDAINTLTVLDGTRSIPNSKLKTWTQWEPYKDDLIALYFYDVVNDKYIPFRAAIKGLSENGNASWEELPFIGRADKVYSYSGFNRNVSLTLHIVINSITELAPTWQRINYISTAIKPSNYTTAKLNLNDNVITNRFMIPPMFMMTIGNLYRDQPILVQSITFTVPDDAAWETMNEDNASGLDWNYLANIISAPGILFGQLPREIEIGFTLILLEKERAIVGGANFGHAPRNEDWSGWNTDTVPERGSPKKLDQSLVVPAKGQNIPLVDAGVPFQNSPSSQTIASTG